MTHGLTDLEAALLRMVRGGADPYGYDVGQGPRATALALRRLTFKGLIVWASTAWTATEVGIEALTIYDEQRDHHP